MRHQHGHEGQGRTLTDRRYRRICTINSEIESSSGKSLPVRISARMAVTLCVCVCVCVCVPVNLNMALNMSGGKFDFNCGCGYCYTVKTLHVMWAWLV